MIRRMAAGFLLVVAGAAFAVGVFPNWAHVAGQNLNGFSFAGSNLDAIISFAVAAVLIVLGLGLSALGGLITRLLALCASICALAWAGLIALIISGYLSRVTSELGAMREGTFHLGYYITAGGAVLAILGGLAAAFSRQPRVVVRREPAAAAPQPAAAPTSGAPPVRPLTAGVPPSNPPAPTPTQRTVEPPPS